MAAANVSAVRHSLAQEIGNRKATKSTMTRCVLRGGAFLAGDGAGPHECHRVPLDGTSPASG